MEANVRSMSAAVLGSMMLLSTAACGGSSGAPAASAPTYSTAEQAALDALHPGCTQDDATLDRFANNALGLLEKAGIHDETKLTVLQHLRQSIPASSPSMDCQQMLGAYVTLRESPGGG
jgi:3-oxoacyl-ACP reductase-like protein